MSLRRSAAPPWGGRVVLSVGLVLAAGLRGAAADQDAPKLRLGLGLEYEHFSYSTNKGGTLVDSRDAFTAIPGLDWTPRDNVLLRYSVLLRKDYSEAERTRAFVYEDFLNLERDAWSLKIGRQFVRWGRADSLRPTDVFQRHDFIDLVENREEGIEVVKLDLLRGARTVEFVWAPVFDPDVLSYRSRNRWIGIPTVTDVPGFGPVRLTFKEDSRRRPPATLESGQIGVRFSGSARGWDFAGMFYDGYDRVPTIIKRELAAVDLVARTATLRLVPSHSRIQVVGGDFATAIAGWGLRGEAAYTRTADLAPGTIGINECYVRVAAGVDRTFSRLALGESLSVIVQYALDTEPEQPGPINQQEVDPRLHPYRQALVVNTAWKLSESVQTGFKGYVNLVENDFLLQPELSWKPRDSVTIVLGGDVLRGRPTTFFGQYRDNDRVRFLLAYAF